MRPSEPTTLKAEESSLLARLCAMVLRTLGGQEDVQGHVTEAVGDGAMWGEQGLHLSVNFFVILLQCVVLRHILCSS